MAEDPYFHFRTSVYRLDILYYLVGSAVEHKVFHLLGNQGCLAGRMVDINIPYQGRFSLQDQIGQDAEEKYYSEQEYPEEFFAELFDVTSPF